MEDFTGGMTEIFDLRQLKTPNLFRIMEKSFTKGSLMGCSIEVSCAKRFCFSCGKVDHSFIYLLDMTPIMFKCG